MRPEFKDPIFSGPLVRLLYVHRHEVPDAQTDPTGHIDFVECFVGDFLVRLCRRAGAELFLKYLHAATAQPPQAMLHAAWPFATLNAATALAVNACRHLWEEALPTIRLAAQRLPQGEEEEALRLRFCEAEMRYDWVKTTTEEEEEEEPLLRSFRARQARRGCAHVV